MKVKHAPNLTEKILLTSIKKILTMYQHSDTTVIMLPVKRNYERLRTITLGYHEKKYSSKRMFSKIKCHIRVSKKQTCNMRSTLLFEDSYRYGRKTSKLDRYISQILPVKEKITKDNNSPIHHDGYHPKIRQTLSLLLWEIL